MLTSIPPSTGVKRTSANERTLGASSDAWVVSTPTTGQPAALARYHPGRRVLDHQTALRREPEQLRAHQIGRRIGFADAHVIGRHHDGRPGEPGRRDPGAGQPHSPAGHDGDPVRRQRRQHLVRSRLCDNTYGVGRFGLDHEDPQLLDPFGRHLRFQHGHHLGDRHTVDVRLDLRPRPADLVGKLPPAPLHTAGRIHQGAVQVEQDRVHQPRRHGSTLTHGTGRRCPTLERARGSSANAGRWSGPAQVRHAGPDHPLERPAVANANASIATTRPGWARSETPSSPARSA